MLIVPSVSSTAICMSQLWHGQDRGMRSQTISLTTGSRAGVFDLTGECTEFLSAGDAEDGLLSVFVPHATAGVAILESGAGSDDPRGIARTLRCG